jgi:hypothetical protein
MLEIESELVILFKLLSAFGPLPGSARETHQ